MTHASHTPPPDPLDFWRGCLAGLLLALPLWLLIGLAVWAVWWVMSR